MRLWRKKPRLRQNDQFQIVLYVLLTLLAVFMLLPLIYIFNHALKPYNELFIYPPRIFAQHVTLQNFVELFIVSSSSAVPVTRYVFNSVITTGMIVFAVTIISALCAYPLSKHQFPGRKLLFAVILLSLMFAPETVAIPRYLVAANLGIMNTYWGHLLPNLAAPVSVFLMRQFIDQVPNELMEAAKMDGAGEVTIFLRVVIPMIMPAVATVAILTFQGAWGNVETSRLFMQDEAMKTFPFFLSTLTNGLANNVARQGAAAAAAVILFLPNFIIFLFFQRKVVATMAHSGIK
ncbi:carbohydrate ABC transporter permease [Paenibacillus eucommiae]|uniref:ABC-type glycerol-3-phosphate transport system permease component n=1 Tax=Paenibacillus eucommiae TaxID=1355755 RepID=A0ABS4JAK9_9BACL|nr:carbohydrate ABC transporter permease [Paenibacillus eucommiae]MBP1996840.1 ABC-type glycerol-3-phosphate transport system permease component [Paenibacillus eucommiae]